VNAWFVPGKSVQQIGGSKLIQQTTGLLKLPEIKISGNSIQKKK
jgi:hypothetical protein